MAGKIFAAGNRIRILTGLLVALVFYFIKQYNFLLFHSLAEIFSVVISFGIFVVAWNSRKFSSNDFFLFFGISLLFVSIFETLYTLSYPGMGVFPALNLNQAIQFRIISRYLLSFSLLGSFYFLKRRIKIDYLIIIFVCITVLFLYSIFGTKFFPVCFSEGTGFTQFKKASEYVVASVFFFTFLVLYTKRNTFDAVVFKLLVSALFLFIFRELISIQYYNEPVSVFLQFVARCFTILGFYLMYKAIIEITLSKPYDVIFRGLKENQKIIKRLNDELNRKIMELTAINNDLEAFNHTISHDIKTPLIVIEGFADLLLKKPADCLTDKHFQYLKIIHDETRRAKLLIDGLMHFFLSTHKKIEVENLHMEEIVVKVFKELRLANPGREIYLALKPLPEGRGDPLMIEEVMHNLVSNAIKFTKPKHTANIMISGWSEATEDVYCVKDNGVGFDMHQVDRIFNILERLHPREDFEGCGVGLAIVQRVIQRHNGRVWAESELNEGSSFYFTLPKG